MRRSNDLVNRIASFIIEDIKLRMHEIDQLKKDTKHKPGQVADEMIRQIEEGLSILTDERFCRNVTRDVIEFNCFIQDTLEYVQHAKEWYLYGE